MWRKNLRAQIQHTYAEQQPDPALRSRMLAQVAVGARVRYALVGYTSQPQIVSNQYLPELCWSQICTLSDLRGLMIGRPQFLQFYGPR